MSRFRLSKSKVMSWSQCPKRLWFEVQRPDLLVVPPETQRIFDLGHQVGEVARSLHPEGVLIDPPSLGEAARETARLLARSGDLTLFEATFSHGGVLVRTDLLFRSDDAFRLVEVKSSTAVKDHHVADSAVQAWVLRGCGLPLDRVAVSVVDCEFVYAGDGDYHGLFAELDVSAGVEALIGDVAGWVAGCQETLAGDVPDIDMGSQCRDPFACPFIPVCSADLPEFPVSILPDARGTDVALAEAGHADVRDIPPDWPLNELQQRVRRATRMGEPEFDAEASAELRRLSWPRFYVDFETAQPAVPVWAGTRPWEQLPFQWSCHIERAGGKLEHAEFLDISGEAPMRPCAETLLQTLGDEGPVFVYSGFERRILRELAARFPDLGPALLAVVERLLDLLPLTKAAYYHPAMKGSWSLKDVLPTVAPDLDYAALGEVQDGTLAQLAYAEAVHPDTEPPRADELATALLAYCRYDTLALVRLRRFLAGE